MAIQQYLEDARLRKGELHTSFRSNKDKEDNWSSVSILRCSLENLQKLLYWGAVSQMARGHADCWIPGVVIGVKKIQ